MKKVVAIISLFFLSATLFSQNWVWESHLDAISGKVKPISMKSTPSGNIVTLLSFDDNLKINNVSFKTKGKRDILLLVYNKYGKLQWFKQIGSDETDSPKMLYVDNKGAIYVIGAFSKTVDFGGQSLTSTDGEDGFVAKYDATGRLIFVKTIATGDYLQRARTITSDGDNFYVTGFFYSEADLSDTTFLGNGAKNQFLVKYDNRFNLLFAKKIAATGRKILFADIKWINKNVYAIGYFEDTLKIENKKFVSKYRNTIILKFSESGQLIWGKQFKGFDNTAWSAFSDDNYLYVPIDFYRDLSFASTTITSAGDYDIAIAKLDLNGNLKWLVQNGGGATDWNVDIIGTDTKLVLSGSFSNHFKWGETQLEAPENVRMPFVGFVNKEDGKFEKALKIDADLGANSGVRLVVDSKNNLYVAGTFTSDKIYFGNNQSFEKGNNKQDAFLAKYGCFDGVTLKLQDTRCGNDASITAVPNEGFGPFHYKWSNDATTQTVSNLPAGRYSVTVTDDNGCQATAKTRVSRYRRPKATIVDHGDVACYGDATGWATVEVKNGVPPYTYKWSNGANGTTAYGLKAGTYKVVVKDQCGKRGKDTVTITQPDSLQAYIEADKAYGFFTICLVHLIARPSGGVEPYSYQWSSDEDDTNQDVWLSGDEYYSLTITDANACELAGWFYLPDYCNSKKSMPVNTNEAFEPTKEMKVLGGYCEGDVETSVVEANPSLKKYLKNKGFGLSNVEIYPNPTNDKITVNIDLLERQYVLISVKNSLGQELYLNDIDGAEHEMLTIDMHKYPDGIYFVEVQTNQKRYITKVVKMSR